LTIVKAVNCH